MNIFSNRTWLYLYFLVGVPNKVYGKGQNFRSILLFPTSLIFIKEKF